MLVITIASLPPGALQHGRELRSIIEVLLE
jgi:hypothetical protein